MTNKYTSPNSTIVASPGTMYNEITRPRQKTKTYYTNDNTYAVTVPKIPTKVKKSHKSKSKKTKK